MTYIWFNTILEFAGKILNFESVSCMYGRTSFDKKSAQATQKVIMEANPLHKVSSKGSAAALIGMGGKMAVIEASDRKAQLKQAEKTMGDMSWIEEFIGGGKQ